MPISEDNIVRIGGNALAMTHYEALAYCKQSGGHLPSTREWAMFMNPAAVLEIQRIEAEFHGVPPQGFYLVAGVDEKGIMDSFYYNNDKGVGGEKPRVPPGSLAKLSFWTSTIVIGKPDYAHVFYGQLGGGGGEPADHERNQLHAVVRVP